jgi:hypothetical protein
MSWEALGLRWFNLMRSGVVQVGVFSPGLSGYFQDDCHRIDTLSSVSRRLRCMGLSRYQIESPRLSVILRD